MLMDLRQLIIKYNLNIKGIIHIGAHYGLELDVYIKENIKNIIFFEPLSDNYRMLLDNIKSHNIDYIKTYNMALGNMVGEVEMYVEVDNTGMSSSILEPKLHLTQYPHIRFNTKELVNIDKLDNIEYDKYKYNFINIDVQGYELEVFKGSINILNDIDYIMTEINRDYLYKDCVLENELDLFLSTFGFVRVETYWAGGTWGDALYIKK